ncbi:hypothetical protein BJ980_001989 [Nocardioides daedukensis]|uniref:DoxX family protein n=1 Tax=Nocardioides daedukensis TaxID=634462 RepID=A0A7Y9UQY6_9ACTN|nr:DoxX family protein [Nocardioides daedukensis]NYG59066.1 hypothetical protein [Nocardioides daedukensis]
MSTTHPSRTATTGSARHIAGLVVTGLVTLFLAFDAVTHLLDVQAVQDWNAEHGAPDWFGPVCGTALAISLVVHLIPRTAVLGATLLTGYLGGAIAVNLFLEQPVFNSVFAFAVAVLAWGGLWLRDDRVRALYTA